jgi:hypothetical protein
VVERRRQKWTTFDGVIPPREFANAKLVAAAPDMARVLLALQVPECVWCHHSEHDRHRDGCPLGAALEKAGADDWPADFNPLRTTSAKP